MEEKKESYDGFHRVVRMVMFDMIDQLGLSTKCLAAAPVRADVDLPNLLRHLRETRKISGYLMVDELTSIADLTHVLVRLLPSVVRDAL